MERLLNLFFIVGLALISTSLILSGPIVKLFRDDYIKIEEYLDIAEVPVEFPAISVCRYPGFRHTVKHLLYKERYPNKSIVEIRQENIFQPVEIIRQIVISSGNENHNVDPRELDVVIKDLQYIGSCIKISKKLMERYIGDINMHYHVAIQIASEKDVEDKASYPIYVHPDIEDIYAGPFKIREAGVLPIVAGWSTFSIISLQYEYRIRSVDCNETEGYTMTACMTEFYDRKYNNCSVETLNQREGCTEEKLIQRLKEEDDIIQVGYKGFNKVTNCKLPCRSMVYETSKDVSVDAEPFFRSYYDKNVSNVTAVWFGYMPHGHSIKTVSEIKSYGLNEFQSDVGGTLGLFIGFSVYSVFGFMADRLRKYTCKK